jgi:hypothetical protein
MGLSIVRPRREAPPVEEEMSREEILHRISLVELELEKLRDPILRAWPLFEAASAVAHLGLAATDVMVAAELLQGTQVSVKPTPVISFGERRMF